MFLWSHAPIVSVLGPAPVIFLTTTDAHAFWARAINFATVSRGKGVSSGSDTLHPKGAGPEPQIFGTPGDAHTVGARMTKFRGGACFYGSDTPLSQRGKLSVPKFWDLYGCLYGWPRTTKFAMITPVDEGRICSRADTPHSRDWGSISPQKCFGTPILTPIRFDLQQPNLA